MVSRQIRVLGFICLCLLSLSACGAQSDKSSSTSKPVAPAKQHPAQIASFDPCTLFSKDDVSHVLGGAVDVQPEFGSPMCTYKVHAGFQSPRAKGPKTADMMDPEQRRILVTVGNSDDARGYVDQDRLNTDKGIPTRIIQGVGSSAFSVPLKTGKAIIGSQGNTVYTITMIYPHMDATLMDNSLKTLAQDASRTIAANAPTLAAPAPHPCSMVNAQKASQLFQQPVKWFFTVNGTGAASCDYITTKGTPHRVEVISVNRADIAKELYNSVDRKLASDNKQTLKGIGDAALYDKRNSTWILKGDTVVHLIILGETSAEKMLLPLSKDVVKHF
ncbi:hypothetical protein KDW_29490 [Dictyobacter vulcani]|uniref:DUF4367 domain-containing protein n=1 Tax=Dictyobacter vulcani TaxID=2607529 RepID=A0A5J4KQZ8_9CHLR|nr:DUF3558 family protein [Dictyobacter vulcani]GER88787.1 hypothetical protein KDW_29490 [Dictyobacter vulcani]